MVATTIVNQGLGWMGVGFVANVADKVIEQIEGDGYVKKTVVESLIEKSVLAHEDLEQKQTLNVKEALRQSMSEHLGSPWHEATQDKPRQPPQGEPLELAFFWTEVGPPDKGTLLLNGMVRDRTEYGQRHLVSVGNDDPMVMKVAYGDLETRSGGRDPVGRLHEDDFEALFGALEVGLGFAEVRQLNTREH